MAAGGRNPAGGWGEDARSAIGVVLTAAYILWKIVQYTFLGQYDPHKVAHWTNVETGAESELAVSAMFIFIGVAPRSEIQEAIKHTYRLEESLEQFRHHDQVLVSTEAGGEGRNLQFARIVVNYDLPWNPMRLEQRIGRVHRLGQAHEVRVVNLVSRGTLEAYVLEILERITAGDGTEVAERQGAGDLSRSTFAPVARSCMVILPPKAATTLLSSGEMVAKPWPMVLGTGVTSGLGGAVLVTRTEPAVRPATIYFCANRNSNTVGRIVRVMKARMRCHSDEYSP